LSLLKYTRVFQIDKQVVSKHFEEQWLERIPTLDKEISEGTLNLLALVLS